MLKTILNWLTGNLVGQLTEAYKAKLAAQNDAERLAAEQRIKALEVRQAVLLSEQAHWSTRWVRPAIAAPFVIYIAKVVVWDKVLGLGTTDPLSTDFHNLMMVVIGAYFIARPFEKWASRK